jgi:hypothetical protein
VIVTLSDLDSDEGRLELATASLRAELLDLEVDDVVSVIAGQAPPGTRAVDVSLVGKLLVVLPQAYESLRNVVACVQQWLARDVAGRSAELELNGNRLVVTGLDRTTQQRLIEAWLRAQAVDDVDEGMES